MESYNSQLLPTLQQSMDINIDTNQEILDTFNQVQYSNVSNYNTYRCKYQWLIASYQDTIACLKKYSYPYNDSDAMGAMCFNNIDIPLKEHVQIKFIRQ